MLVEFRLGTMLNLRNSLSISWVQISKPRIIAPVAGTNSFLRLPPAVVLVGFRYSFHVRHITGHLFRLLINTVLSTQACTLLGTTLGIRTLHFLGWAGNLDAGAFIQR